MFQRNSILTEEMHVDLGLELFKHLEDEKGTSLPLESKS